MKKLLQSISLFLVLVAVPVYGAATLKEMADYLVTTGESFTVAWDDSSSPPVSYYEVKAFHEEKTGVTVNVGQSSVKQIIMSLPQTGHWRLEVRGCRSATDCSEWSSSTTKGVKSIDGVVSTMNWRVFVRPAPPSGVVVR